MIRRFATGVALATGLALSITGCLGEAGDKAGEAGEKAGEAGENLKLTAAQVLGKTAEKTGGTDSLTADLSAQMPGSGSMNGEIQYRTKPDPAYRMHFDAVSVGGRSLGEAEQLLLGGNLYIKLPSRRPSGGGAPSGKPWVKMPLGEIGKQSGISFDRLLQQSQQMDPVQTAQQLTASKDVREVGKEAVGGVQTTHYTGSYRAEDAVAKLPPEAQELYRRRMTQMGLETYSFNLWVDGEHLPRKLTLKAQMNDGAMTTTIKYRDFGEPVQITAPPANQVTDYGEMMNGLGSGN